MLNRLGKMRGQKNKVHSGGISSTQMIVCACVIKFLQATKW